MVNLWVLENFLVPISVTLGQGHQATEAGQILPCPRDKVRTAHSIATKPNEYISLFMLATWLNFEGILSETFFFYKFYVKFQLLFWELDFKNGSIATKHKANILIER